jgi:RimJ/RimL family protein N-acetyltransferase
MITREHSVIRTAGREDAPALRRYYSLGHPMAALLDQRREFLIPTAEEVAEVLGGSGLERLGGMNAIEDGTGVVRGFCAIRSTPNEPYMGQVVLMFESLSDYDSPLASEVMEYLREEAFARKRLRKAMAYLLDDEHTLRAYLLRHGFESDGVQREVLYAAGRWYNLETLSLFAPGRFGGHEAVSSNEVRHA